MFMQWGQLLDHDLDFTPSRPPAPPSSPASTVRPAACSSRRASRSGAPSSLALQPAGSGAGEGTVPRRGHLPSCPAFLLQAPSKPALTAPHASTTQHLPPSLC